MSAPTAVEPRRRMSLYHITDNLLALDELLEESGGEDSPELAAWRAEYGDALLEKVDAIGGYWRHLEADIKAIKDEEDRLAVRRRVVERKLERLRHMVTEQFQRLGTRKVAGTLFTLAMQKHGGQRPLRLHVAPEELPVEFQRVRIEANKEVLRELMGDREEFIYPTMGVLASLEPAGESLRLR